MNNRAAGGVDAGSVNGEIVGAAICLAVIRPLADAFAA
jgi:hypothetical protein